MTQIYQNKTKDKSKYKIKTPAWKQDNSENRRSVLESESTRWYIGKFVRT